MDRRCRKCLHHVQWARKPCPECGIEFPLHGYPRDGLLGRERRPLNLSPGRQWCLDAMAHVPPWLGVPLALFLAAIVGVSLVAIIARFVF